MTSRSRRKTKRTKQAESRARGNKIVKEKKKKGPELRELNRTEELAIELMQTRSKLAEAKRDESSMLSQTVNLKKTLAEKEGEIEDMKSASLVKEFGFPETISFECKDGKMFLKLPLDEPEEPEEPDVAEELEELEEPDVPEDSDIEEDSGEEDDKEEIAKPKILEDEPAKQPEAAPTA